MGNINFNQDSLEFENFKITIEKDTSQKDTSQKDTSQKDNSQEDQEAAIDFSIKLVSLLESKAKEHNSSVPNNEVSLNDLRSVYAKGALNPRSDKSCGEWALARVNMFLRQKAGGKMISAGFEQKVGLPIDISETWIPTEEDYVKAQEEMKANNLNYDFKNIDELYVEPYEKLEIEW